MMYFSTFKCDKIDVTIRTLFFVDAARVNKVTAAVGPNVDSLRVPLSTKLSSKLNTVNAAADEILIIRYTI